MSKRILFPILAMLLGILLFASMLEIVLWFLPVSDGSGRMPVNAERPVLSLAPNRDLLASFGWKMSRPTPKHVNNAGFYNPVDYDGADERPLLAIVGDSYVEALNVVYPETCAGRLAARIGDGGRVYTFAISGAPLSQYLVWARDAKGRYRPDRLVVVVVGNDFDESLLKYKHEHAGHTVFDVDERGELFLKRMDFAPSLEKRILRKSALMRYLFINLNVMAFPQYLERLASGENDMDRYVGNAIARASPERLRDSKRAVDKFLDDLPEFSGLAPSKILLVIDGMRPQLYFDEYYELAQESFMAQMRRYLIAQAAPRGYEIVDLEVVFQDHWAEHGERFEFPDDGHWNSLGNAVCADQVAGSRVFGEFAELAREVGSAER